MTETTYTAVVTARGRGVDQQTADELGAGAHEICPYSKATRDNVPVTIDATLV